MIYRCTPGTPAALAARWYWECRDAFHAHVSACILRFGLPESTSRYYVASRLLGFRLKFKSKPEGWARLKGQDGYYRPNKRAQAEDYDYMISVPYPDDFVTSRLFLGQDFVHQNLRRAIPVLSRYESVTFVRLPEWTLALDLDRIEGLEEITATEFHAIHRRSEVKR